MANCRRTGKGLRLTLEANEADVIRFLGRELRRLLEGGKRGGDAVTAFSPSRQRSRDPLSVETGLEGEMEAELKLHRLRRIETVRKELFSDSEPGKKLVMVLDSAKTDVWIAYLADLRLLLAEVIGINPRQPDPFTDTDPDTWTLEMKMYEFLSVLQEGLLDAEAKRRRGEEV